MAEIKCDLKDFAALFEKNEKKRLASVWDGVAEGARRSVDVLREAAPKDTGELRSSIHVTVAGRSISVDIDAPHALLVDQGTRPHRPPIQPLIEWAGRHAGAFGLNTEREIESFAYAIATKIEQEGTRPTFFIRDAQARIEQIILDQILVAMRKSTL